MKDDRDESSSLPPQLPARLPAQLPARLIDGHGPTAEILRRFTRQGWPAPSEAGAWERTVVRLAKGSRVSRMKMGLAVIAGACAMAVVVGVVGWPRPAEREAAMPGNLTTIAARAPGMRAPSSARAATPSLPLPAEMVHEQLLSLQDGPVRLPAGISRLGHHSRITLSREGQAHAASLSGGLTLVLEDGELGLDERATPPHDAPVVVVASPYRLVVLGAAFRVTRTRTDVVVSVDAGQLRVEREGATVAMVAAGRQWSGAISPAGALRPRRDAPPTVAPRQQEENVAGDVVVNGAVAHAALADDNLVNGVAVAPRPLATPVASSSCSAEAAPEDLLRCLSRAAEGQTLSSEVALYQAAQVYRSSLHDPEGALAALRQLRTRFLAGALRAEVSVSLAELLPQLGRYQDALAETETALQLSATAKRTAEVHLLRARILAVGLHDCARAQGEYQAAALRGVGASAIRAESQSELARCLRTGKGISP